MSTKYFIVTDKARPDFRLLVSFLWGDEHDVDTDGDAKHPASTDWTDLYCANRQNATETFEVTVIQSFQQTILKYHKKSQTYMPVSNHNHIQHPKKDA